MAKTKKTVRKSIAPDETVTTKAVDLTKVKHVDMKKITDENTYGEKWYARLRQSPVGAH